MHQNFLPASLTCALAALALSCAALPPPGDDAGFASDGGMDGGASGPDGGAGQNGDGGLPFEAACQVLNQQACDYLQRCGLLEDTAATRADCEAYLTLTRCGPSRWPARVQAGTLKYHPGSATACAQAWGSHACGAFLGEPKVCEDVTSPNAALGTKCYGGLRPECQDGVCTGGTCPRTCRARGGPDELCEDAADCLPELYCRPSSGTGAIGICSAYGLSGAPCDPLRPCARDYVCGQFSTCEAASKMGEPCTSGSCTDDAYCSPSSKTCLPRGSTGAACAYDDQCLLDLLCVPQTGTCQPRANLGPGATCTRAQTCLPGLTCVGTREADAGTLGLGTCEQGRAAGDACTSSWDCASPMACGPVSHGTVCGPRLADGAPCEAGRDCQLLSDCLQGLCTRLPPAGEACAQGTCLYGSCDFSDDAGNVCRGPGGPNTPCEQGDDCASLRCVSGRCLAACSP
jgi:hypothetical protein